MAGHVYLLQEREFINAQQHVYKIGQSMQVRARISSYPKGSEVKMIVSVNDCIAIERRLIETFDSKFKKRIDIGREYYEGDVTAMMKEMTMIALESPTLPDVGTESIQCPYSLEDVNAKIEPFNRVVALGPKVPLSQCVDYYLIRATTDDTKWSRDAFRRTYPEWAALGYDNLLMVRFERGTMQVIYS